LRRYRNRAEFLDQIRAMVRQDVRDIMLMSASNPELLNGEKLFQKSAVQPAIRANDTTCIWRMSGRRVRSDDDGHFLLGEAEVHGIDSSRLAISADALHRLLRLEALRPTHASDLPRVALADCLGLAHAAAGASLRSISTVGSVETSRRRLERARAWDSRPDLNRSAGFDGSRAAAGR
jgi:hypothetical protein